MVQQANRYFADGRTKYIWYASDGTEQLFDLIAGRPNRLLLHPALGIKE